MYTRNRQEPQLHLNLTLIGSAPLIPFQAGYFLKLTRVGHRYLFPLFHSIYEHTLIHVLVYNILLHYFQPCHLGITLPLFTF
jgi:hypothetical protein